MKELTFRDLLESFCEFLLVAIHTILYERELYPSDLFIAARKYGHPVRQARHPRVCRWIKDAVSACNVELIKCSVSRICLVIISPENIPMERFVFDVSTFPELSLDTTTMLLASDGKEGQPGSGLGRDMEEQFRAALVKLVVGTQRLGKLPENCSFSLAMELKDETLPLDGNPPVWIAAERHILPRSLKSDDTTFDIKQKVKVTPVRSINISELAFEVWIEEGVEKQNYITEYLD